MSFAKIGTHQIKSQSIKFNEMHFGLWLGQPREMCLAPALSMIMFTACEKRVPYDSVRFVAVFNGKTPLYAGDILMRFWYDS